MESESIRKILKEDNFCLYLLEQHKDRKELEQWLEFYGSESRVYKENAKHYELHKIPPCLLSLSGLIYSPVFDAYITISPKIETDIDIGAALPDCFKFCKPVYLEDSCFFHEKIFPQEDIAELEKAGYISERHVIPLACLHHH